jgi:hypothetical protein
MNDGKLYEAFPMIRLHLTNGERIELDYFGTKTLSYIPTRFMEKSEDAIIPIVKYLSKFKTEKEVVKIFMEEMSLEMRDYHKNIFCVGGNQFVNWDTVCKIEILMQQYVYCYDNPVFVGNSKHVRSESEARFISQVKEFELDTDMSIIEGGEVAKEKEVEMDLRFLDCPEFMGMKV